LDNSALIDDLIKNKCSMLCPLECYQYSFETKIYTRNLLGDEYYASLIMENSKLLVDFLYENEISPEQAIESVVQLTFKL
jgi:hypothetical protein